MLIRQRNKGLWRQLRHKAECDKETNQKRKGKGNKPEREKGNRKKENVGQQE